MRTDGVAVAARGRRAAVAMAWAGLTVLGPVPAGATPEGGEGLSGPAASSTGACGWWGQETTRRFMFVSLCVTDGVWWQDGRPVVLPGPVVSVSSYSCPKETDEACIGEDHSSPVPTRDVAFDPLVRRATVDTRLGSCSVAVEFSAVSDPDPSGGASEYHGGTGEPTVGVWATQGMRRRADWWGDVCGRLVMPGEGEGDLWRDVTAFVGTSPGGPR